MNRSAIQRRNKSRLVNQGTPPAARPRGADGPGPRAARSALSHFAKITGQPTRQEERSRLKLEEGLKELAAEAIRATVRFAQVGS